MAKKGAIRKAVETVEAWVGIKPKKATGKKHATKKAAKKMPASKTSAKKTPPLKKSAKKSGKKKPK